MKHFYNFTLVSILMLICPFTYAQIDTTFENNETINVLEEIIENQDAEEIVLSEDILESIIEENRIDNRPNINTLSYEKAVKQFQLSEYQYYQLQLYIEMYGALASIYELKAIEGFDDTDIERLKERVSVLPIPEKSAFFKDFWRRSKSNLLLRYGQVLEKQAGYDTARSTHYAGSPSHLCFRYNFNAQDKFFIKFSGEKDPGEQFFQGAQKQGFDFYSASISIKNMGIVQAAVLGDYRLNFGQGLALGSSLLSGKGGDPGSLRKFSTGIRAIAPTNEGDFLRGAAITLGNTKFQGTLFAGRSFGTSNNALGIDLLYRHAHFKIGGRIIGYSTTDTTLETASDRWRSSFTPNGFNASIDYQTTLKRILLFGEIAINEIGRIGTMHALIANPTATDKIALVFRHYGQDYAAPLGSEFGGTSSHSALTGIYVSASHIVSKHCQLSTYYDYYHINGPSYRADFPLTCMDFGANMQYQINKRHNFSIRYTFKTKPENLNENLHFKTLNEHHRHKIQGQFSSNPLDILKLKTGINWILNSYPLKKEKHSGILLYQDFSFNIKHPDISIQLRAAFFDTYSFEERLYAYESDVYYAFTIGSYYYKGTREYLVVRYKHKWFSIWLRLSHTHYIDRQNISSGLTQINQSHKTEIKIQSMFSF